MGSTQPSFRDAVQILSKIPKDRLLSPFNPHDYEDSLDLARAIHDRHGTPYCPVCGWPKGTPGFVRLPFPIGHELFGRAWPCPNCNGGGR